MGTKPKRVTIRTPIPKDRVVVIKPFVPQPGFFGPPTYILQTGKLSLRAQLELDERTRKGEDPVAVKAELLLREGKGIPG